MPMGSIPRPFSPKLLQRTVRRADRIPCKVDYRKAHVVYIVVRSVRIRDAVADGGLRGMLVNRCTMNMVLSLIRIGGPALSSSRIGIVSTYPDHAADHTDPHPADPS